MLFLLITVLNKDEKFLKILAEKTKKNIIAYLIVILD